MSNSEKKDNSAPIIEDKITVRNYKCFDEEGADFEKIMPINIIIGKNNSGKSSLIDAIMYLSGKESDFSNGYPEVYIQRKITHDELVDKDPTFLQDKSDFTSDVFTYRVRSRDRNNSRVKGIGFENAKYNKFENTNTDMEEAIAPKGIEHPLIEPNRTFVQIKAERDILPTKNEDWRNFPINGKIATLLVVKTLLQDKFQVDSDKIKVELLHDLNKVVNPDIKVHDIRLSQNYKDEWEIKLKFNDESGKTVALSNMGSGMKTILLVLLNLIITELFAKEKKNYVFAFEELENNLHPALQRKLYDYIKKYSKKYGCYFFFTTHSNVVIDVFGTYEHAQIIHVKHDGKRSTTRTILHKEDSKRILRDLGVKASDLLQSNGVIWVEGPSDRNYLNKWIHLRVAELISELELKLKPESIPDSEKEKLKVLKSKLEDLREGLHYSIMTYGGDLRSNLTFDENWIKENLIPLLKINSNAYIIMDRDGENEKVKLNKSKQRIIKEIKKGNYWVTEGREIENYLSDKVVKSWLSERYKEKYKTQIAKFKNEKNTKLEGNIFSASKSMLDYSSKKKFYSSQIAKCIGKDSLEVLDLKEKLDELIKRIIEWNE